MRGLPFSADKGDIIRFFEAGGLRLSKPLSEDSIHIVTEPSGRPAGIAFVVRAQPSHEATGGSDSQCTLRRCLAPPRARAQPARREAAGRRRASSGRCRADRTGLPFQLKFAPSTRAAPQEFSTPDEARNVVNLRNRKMMGAPRG